MHRFVFCSLWAITGVVIGFLMGACASSEKAEGRTEPIQKDPLSYGNVTSRVQKGVTTQADLVELFGGPNISTIDADGTETWVYERTASESSVTGEGLGTAEAKRLDLCFVFAYFTTSKGKRTATGTSRYEQSIKSLTVIIKFNGDRTVKEYSARASRF